jgi:hypothetical protein
MKPILICLVGRGLDESGKFESSARVGKDEVARVLASDFGHRISPFALPFKQTCQVLFGLPDHIIWNDALKFSPIEHWGFTPRQMFQSFGTEGGRQVFSDTLWVDMNMSVWEDVKMGKPFTFDLLTDKALEVKSPSTEDDFDFIISRSAQIMFKISGDEAAFSRAHSTPVCALGLTFDEITDKLKHQTLPIIMKMPFAQAWPAFKKIRSLYPTMLTASTGPYGVPPKIANGMTIPDGRFFNELSISRDNNAHICFVERILPSTVEKVTGHISETEMIPLEGDTIIKNNGTMLQLKDKVHTFVESLQDAYVSFFNPL